MPFQAIPNTLQASIRMTLFSNLIENELYFIKPGGYSYSDVTALGDLVADWITDTWAVNFSSQLTFRQVYVRGLGEAEDLEYVASLGDLAGGNPGLAMPGNVAWAVRRLTGLTGRAKRGRIYLSGMVEAHVSGNVVDTAWANAVLADLMTLNSLAVAADFVPAVVSRVGTGGLANDGEAFAMTTWSYADLNVDSQRRRLNGRGT